MKVISIDDEHLEHGTKSKSYMVYRQNSLNNSTSFILDLQFNENFNSHVVIEHDENRSRTTPTNCFFYTGSVRHWSKSNSLVAISICSGLVGIRCFELLVKLSDKILGWFNSSYTRWNRLFFGTTCQ